MTTDHHTDSISQAFDAGWRLVTLVGAQGTGKSTIAAAYLASPHARRSGVRVLEGAQRAEVRKTLLSRRVLATGNEPLGIAHEHVIEVST